MLIMHVYIVFIVLLALRVAFDLFNSVTQKYLGKSFQSALSHSVLGVVVSLAFFSVLPVEIVVIIWVVANVVLKGVIKQKSRFNLINIVQLLLFYSVVAAATVFAVYSLFELLMVPVWIIFMILFVSLIGFYFLINGVLLPKLLTQVPLEMPYDKMIHKFSLIDDIYVAKSRKFYLPMNALFTGFRKRKRVLLSDKLVARLKSRELKAIIAHEIGHAKLSHLFVRAVILFVAVVGFSLLLQWVFYGQFQPLVFYVQLTVFVMVSWIYFSIFELFTYQVAQHQEYQADAFVSYLGEGVALASALEKINRYESEPKLHPYYQRVFYSHPPLKKRRKNLLNYVLKS